MIEAYKAKAISEEKRLKEMEEILEEMVREISNAGGSKYVIKKEDFLYEFLAGNNPQTKKNRQTLIKLGYVLILRAGGDVEFDWSFAKEGKLGYEIGF